MRKDEQSPLLELAFIERKVDALQERSSYKRLQTINYNMHTTNKIFTVPVLKEMTNNNNNNLLLFLVSVLVYLSAPAFAVLARTKHQFVEKEVVDHDAWKNAGIGEICIPEEELDKKLEELEKTSPNNDTARKELAAQFCGASPKLACNFEVPDMKTILMVCDCKEASETWDETVQQCRRFAGRKQNCTDDAQCVTGAACKNEALKLRDYSRWEAAVFRHHNLTTPRPFGEKQSQNYGKVRKADIDKAAKIRKRILARISRSSYKEEIGECTCTRNELKLEYINKTDPCLARKHPPPLKLAKAHRLSPVEFTFSFLCFSHIMITIFINSCST